MKALIIFGHPDTNIGFAVNMLEAVKNRLQERECDFEVLDLYKMNYDPVLKSSELYTAGNREISSENLQIQQKIKGKRPNFHLPCLVGRDARDNERIYG
jgi:putative NADPH-quinone reductase